MDPDRTRGTTIPQKHLTAREIADGRILTLELEPPRRPRTRADCIDAPRPCPWVGCRYHLCLDIMPSGSLKLNFGAVELEALPDTCALDVADKGGGTLEVVGERLNLTRERVRQVEAKMLVKLHRRLKVAGIDSAEGFIHTLSALGMAQETEGSKGTGPTAVSRAAGELNKKFAAEAEERAAALERTRAARVAELGPKVQE